MTTTYLDRQVTRESDRVRKVATAQKVMQFRLRDEDKERIRKGAELAGVNASQFVLHAALAEAQRLLADRNRFELEDERFDAFMEALESPADSNEALNRLLRTAAPWE